MKTVVNSTELVQYLVSPSEGEIQVQPKCKIYVPDDTILTNESLTLLEEKQ
jgi:hypothetical protein